MRKRDEQKTLNYPDVARAALAGSNRQSLFTRELLPEAYRLLTICIASDANPSDPSGWLRSLADRYDEQD